jgi:outer membrane protein assembly factor BamB
MSNDSTMLASNDSVSAEAAKPVRVTFAVVLVAVFWAFYATAGVLDLGNFPSFLMRFGAVALLLLLFLIWWLTNRSLPGKERLAVLAAAIIGGVIALLVLRDPSVLAPAVLFYAVPIIITAMTFWLVVTRHSSPAWRRLGLFGIPLVAWIASDLVRMDGLSGENTPVFRWRWSPTGEAQFLAERGRVDQEKQPPKLPDAAAAPAVAGPHDWPRFRGPNADGAVHGVRISTDWDQSPPKLLWRRRMGPGWSSLTVVADRIFSQEQRGEDEAVVCFAADTGDELWSHEDKARFYEALGGAGPRATPTFADRRIYALGATGILNCLDAATGELQWTRDIVPEVVKAAELSPDKPSDAPARPIWGYSSSPLVVRGQVLVFAGGAKESSLLAFNVDSGEPTWQVDAGRHSYSSPQLVTLDGVEQILFLSNDELTSVDPASGKVLWRFESEYQDWFPSTQPHVVGPSDLLIAFTEAAGTMRLKVERKGEAWTVGDVWKGGTKALKPYFNDYVTYEDSIYGFDGAIFCCVDLETGKRRWKGGRYGGGQVLLLADQGVLVVITEQGEAVLVAANPEKHEELGKFQAIEGKTWNHPTVIDNKLYIRNAEEMACYELKPPAASNL